MSQQKIERNAKIVKMKEEGYSINKLAVVFGMTKQAVHKIYVRDREKYLK